MSVQISVKPLSVLESVYWHFVKAVCVCVYQGYWYWHVIFLCLPCLVLVLTWVVVLKRVECSPSFQFFWGEEGRIWEGLRLILWMLDEIHQQSRLVLVFYLLGGFWLLRQSPYSWLVCSYFLFLHDSVIVDCIFLGIYPSLWGLSH